MFKVHYHYSACISVKTDDLSILCDPWFTDGAYDGSWFQYPKLTNPIDAIGPCDFIYISHIHPDHFDEDFLKAYLSHYPDAKIIIANFSKNFLAKKMAASGFVFEIVEELVVGATHVKIFPNELNSYDVDSALVITHQGLSLVNMNDNLFNPVQIDKINEYCGRDITLACMGYTGAGPYPQTYYSDVAVLKEKAQQKKLEFFERFNKMRSALGAKKILPFAGKYYLGGKLSHLNDFRGVADAVEVLEFCKEAFVLGDSGKEFYDLENDVASKTRSEHYPKKSVQSFILTLAEKKMDYEVKFQLLDLSDVAWLRLINAALRSARMKSLVNQNYFFVFRLSEKQVFAINVNQNSNEQALHIDIEKVHDFFPRSEVEIDFRLFFGLLNGIYHWNNAEIGSHYQVRRVPDAYDRDVQAYLNFFHI